MSIRYTVTCSNKDEDGDITAIGGTQWLHSKRDAISNINSGLASYYVNGTVRVIIKTRSSGPYLTTEPDSSASNNLDNLKSCSI